MCGIAGLIAWRMRLGDPLDALVIAMTNTLVHRGPDDSGAWHDDAYGIGLGQRRLAIVDLSPLGHQPMHSASGRFAVVFNGEIYNWRELRTELEAQGHRFRSTSDTEVLLMACEAWGVEAALRRFAGMFAIALWDRQTRTMSLARDRLGEKPLFLADLGHGLAFASEVRAFRPLPGWSPTLDRRSVGELLRFGYIASDAGIWQNVVRLPPASLLQWSAAEGVAPAIVDGELRNVRVTRYWSPPDAAALAGPGGRFVGDAKAAVDQLDALLRKVVADELVADVPVGAFLSGGVDSSAVVALAQAVVAQPVRTFSIGFHEPDYDEAPFAKAIAKHLGTDHTEVYVSANDALAVVRDLGRMFDEPFADPSQIPAYMVARIARQHVTVSLSGDGGDAVFGGYNRYFSESPLVRASGALPLAVRRPAAAMLNWMAARQDSRALDALARAMLGGGGDGPVQDLRGRFAKAATLLGQRDALERYWSLVSLWQEPERALPGLEPLAPLRDELAAALQAQPPALAFMQWDLRRYLPGDNLTKVDRTSMAVSLEIRAPLLDHRVLEQALPVLHALGVRGADGATKWPLRMLMDRYIPPALTRRPKMGFSVPVRDWLRGELKGWAGELLGRDALAATGVFAGDAITTCWREHGEGRRDHSRMLWPVLMFQQWWFAQGSDQARGQRG